MVSFRVIGLVTYNFIISFYPMGSFILRVKDDPIIQNNSLLVDVGSNSEYFYIVREISGLSFGIL